jgi:ribosomal protein S13
MALLQERTVLACLHIGVWSGMMKDQDVNEEVATKHNADVKDAGSYSKRLVARKHLHGVSSKAHVISRTHRLLTLPWEDGGVRILSTKTYVAYGEQMRMARLAFDAAVLEFQANLPNYIEDAKRNVLGTMFKPEDYPTADEVVKKFWVDVEIKPVPKAADFRAELSDAATKAIIKDIEKRTDERLAKAMNDVFERVIDVTQHMVERLRAYKPVEGARTENNFRDTLVWNISELAKLLPDLNITGDSRIDELQAQLDDLTENSPTLLRDSEALRLKTADKAEKLLKKVQKYLV